MAKKKPSRPAKKAAEPQADEKAPRRGRGDGSIFQRKDGRFCAAHDRGTKPNGKRNRVYVYGKTKSEVAQKLRQAQLDDATGKRISPAKLTVGEYLDEWFAAPGRDWRRSTVDVYGRVIRDYVKPGIGAVALQKVTPELLVEHYAGLRTADLSGGTQHMAHRLLRQAFAEAIRRKLMTSNPCEAIPRSQKPKTDPTEPKFLTDEQAKAFLDSVRGDRDEALFVFALTGGFRPGELYAMRRADVDPRRKTVTVKRTLTQVGKDFSLGPPKTRRGARSVTMPALAIEAFAEHCRRMDAEGWASVDLLFPNRYGEYHRRGTILNRFNRLLARCGLPPMRMHDLRHSHASLLLQEGVNPKVVSERLGHASVAFTLQVYGHVLPGMGETAADAIGGLFGEEPPAKSTRKGRGRKS